jgi:hypothetical protein
MTDEEKRAYAEKLIRSHAQDVEFLTVFEMSGEDEISDDDARAVHELIFKAEVTVTWP